MWARYWCNGVVGAMVWCGLSVGSAFGQDVMAPQPEVSDERDESENAETDNESAEDEVPLETYTSGGGMVYILCFYGERDNNIVPPKCDQIEREANRAYGARYVIRLNNPSEEQLRRIYDRNGHRIGAVVVVTHSTPDSSEPSGYDVWDCPMSPHDIADIFDHDWVIWNGCYSVGICELADNNLPTQCENGVLSSQGDTWRELMKCLERDPNQPYDRDDICEQVFGDTHWPPQGE